MKLYSLIFATALTASIFYCSADESTSADADQFFTTPKTAAKSNEKAAVDSKEAEELKKGPGSLVYAQVCLACHGAEGEGKEELFTPSIGGLPAWYVEEQIEKFQKGMRGASPEDAPGATMRAISLTLDAQKVADVSAYVSVLPEWSTEAPDKEGFDLEEARYRYANDCMECHRYNGRGEIAFRSASLVTLNKSYLRRALINYREGRRGGDAKDMYGAKMVEQTRRLDDKEIDMFVNYLGALAAGDDPRPARER